VALAQKPVARGQLCELLWDVPNDPRGELRWCLSKIRGLLDDDARRPVLARGDTVQLDLSYCRVDVLDVLRATEAGIETLSPEPLAALAALFNGEFLESLAIDGSPVFTAWLTAQRRRLRGCRTAVLEQLVMRGPDDQALLHLDTWLELAPFDQRAHEGLFKALARRGEIREAEAHLATTVDIFEREGLESTSIRTAWHAARTATGIAIQERDEPGSDTTGRGRASIAVMPFIDRSSAPQPRGGAADGLAYDVITRLAKLRSLFVIAQGTARSAQTRRPRRGSGPPPERGLRRERLDTRAGDTTDGDRGAGRNASSPYRLDRGLQPHSRRCLRGPRRDRESHCRVDCQRD
jgi:DNA-binding SARP family transcriptional activator